MSSPNVPNPDENLRQKLIEALTRGGTREEVIKSRIPKTVVEQALATAHNDPAIIEIIINSIYKEDSVLTTIFYDGLAEVEFRLGNHSIVNELNGLIWARIFSKIEFSERPKFLNILCADGTKSFFVAVRALPSFLKSAYIPPDFLRPWLISIRHRLGDNMASGGFWNGLQAIASSFPENAIALVRSLAENQLDENKIAIAANLLGNLRIETTVESFSILETELRDHHHADRRLVYYRSWIATGFRRTLTTAEFSKVLHQTSIGTKEEIDEGFNVLRNLLPIPAQSSLLLSGMCWLHKHTTAEVSDFWKHFLVVLARELHCQLQSIELPPEIPSLIDLVLTAAPLNKNLDGTWSQIEELLVFLFENDRTAFVKLLFGLSRKDVNSLSKHFRDLGTFNHIVTLMMQNEGTSIVIEALLSSEDPIRHLGFSLFDSIGITELPAAQLNTASDERIAIILYGFQLEPFYDEVVPRFLLALEPRIKSGCRQLQELFTNELLYQCKTLPGACLEILKTRAEGSVLIRWAVDEAEKYFTALRPCFRSSINSIGIVGLERAMRMKSAKQSREMKAQMDKVSILTHLCSTSYTLYGGAKWQTFVGGKLGQPSEMKQISHSAELPRMPGIDPEGLAIRKHQASLTMRGLIAGDNSDHK